MYGSTPQSGGSGSGGDVVGPASATDNAIARFDGTTGKLIQNSGYTINDAGTSIINTADGTTTAPTIGSFLDGSYWGIATKTAGQVQIITSSTASSIFGTAGVLMLNRSTQDGAAKLNIQGAGTTNGKAASIANSSGTTTFYVQDNGMIETNSTWNSNKGQIYINPPSGTFSGIVLGYAGIYSASIYWNDSTSALEIRGDKGSGAKTELYVGSSVKAATIAASGGIGVGTTTDPGAGGIIANTIVRTPNLRISAPTVPASAAASGTAGDIAWDADYIYVCTATNTWKRVGIATW